MLGIQLGSDLYGLDIGGVREIAKLTPLTWVPGAPLMIVGVTNLRGQMLPVVDLRVVLGGEAHPGGAGAVPLPRARIIVVSHSTAQGDVTIGLLVDGVSEVYDLRGPLEPAMGSRNQAASLVVGQVVMADRVLVLLNLPNIIARLLG